MASKFFSTTQQAFGIGFGSSMTIVTTTYRYKRPARRRKALAIAGPTTMGRTHPIQPQPSLSPRRPRFFEPIPTRAAGTAVRGGSRKSATPPTVLAPQCEATPRVTAPRGVASRRVRPHAPTMFVVTEEDAAAIRAVYEQRGEFAAAVELRQRFPGITDNAQARQCARTIAGWKPPRAVKRTPRAPRGTQTPRSRRARSEAPG